MYKLRVSTAILESRLDCSFYNPVGLEYTELLQTNSDLRSLSDLVDPARTITNGVRGPDWQQTKYKLIRLQDCDNWIVNFEEAASISLEQFQENRRCRLKVNDIVVAIGGYIGNAAVLTEDCLAVIGQHSAVLPEPEKQGIDSRYLLAFLNSKIAEAIFCRYVSGTVQAGINLEDLRQLPAPVINAVAQKYIGDKVRQAEQLRAWAKRLENRVQSFHSQFIPDQLNLDFGKKTRKVPSDRMTERLDAHFYPGVVEQYLNTHPHKFESLNALTTVIYNGQTQPESFEGFCKQITVANLSASFIKGQPRKVSSPSKVDKFIKAHDILMCNAAHNKSYIGRELTYVHTDKKLLPSTEVMTIRVNRDLLPASYVRTYLLSRLGYVKVQSTIRGITAHSYPDDVALLDIYIPEVESNQKQEWFKQDELLVQAGCAVEFSQKLTSCAKILVEALIEGQLTERQLIEAQQALEDGDNSLEQAILSKLSVEGYAIEGATPLFSDVDELYSLLEEAAQAEAEE